jgi:hypothetical protein
MYFYNDGGYSCLRHRTYNEFSQKLKRMGDGNKSPLLSTSVKMSYPAPSAPYAAGVMDPAQMRMERLRALCGAHEIRPDFALKLRQLEEFEIVFVADDSGSMNTQINDGSRDPFGAIPTRWSELQRYASNVVEIAACLDPDGIDVTFLNRQGYRNVASISQVAMAFQPPPNGATPLVSTIQAIFHQKALLLKERKMLLIIATDGVPTDKDGNNQTKEFLALMRNRPKNVFVSIIACTDDDNSVGYLNKIDRIVPGIDVSDDYASELKEVKKAQGKDFQFSYGDYVVKTLLGAIDANFDRLDEVRLKSSEVRALAARSVPTGSAGGCCSIM